MRLKASCLLVFCALWMPAIANAQDTLTAIFGSQPRIERLPNGLTVISLPWESPGIVAYYTLMRVGSRDEVEEGHSGFAHLFEHMMFRGTERYPQDAYENLLQGFGADNNAYTTQDFTLYTLTAPSTVLDRIVEVEADRFQHLRYDENAFRTETGAVRGEYDTVVSNPLIKMWESLSEIGFTRHTYRHTTLGYLADIDRMPNEYAYSQRFFQRFYTPDNATIIAVGEVDHAQLMTLVRQHYGSWRGRRDQPRIPVEPEPTSGGARHIDWPGEAAPRVVAGYRTPGFVSGRRPADQNRALRTSATLQAIHGLAFSEPSPLYQRLVVDERTVVEFGSWAGEHARDPGLFVVHATLPQGGNFDPILGAIQAELDSIAQGQIAEDRLAAVKSNLRYSMLSSLETPSDAADLMARIIAVGGDLNMLERYLSELALVSVEDVAHAARDYLNTNRRFVVTLSQGAR